MHGEHANRLGDTCDVVIRDLQPADEAVADAARIRKLLRSVLRFDRDPDLPAGDAVATHCNILHSAVYAADPLRLAAGCKDHNADLRLKRSRHLRDKVVVFHQNMARVKTFDISAAALVRSSDVDPRVEIGDPVSPQYHVLEQTVVPRRKPRKKRDADVVHAVDIVVFDHKIFKHRIRDFIQRTYEHISGSKEIVICGAVCHDAFRKLVAVRIALHTVPRQVNAAQCHIADRMIPCVIECGEKTGRTGARPFRLSAPDMVRRHKEIIGDPNLLDRMTAVLDSGHDITLVHIPKVAVHDCYIPRILIPRADVYRPVESAESESVDTYPVSAHNQRRALTVSLQKRSVSDDPDACQTQNVRKKAFSGVDLFPFLFRKDQAAFQRNHRILLKLQYGLLRSSAALNNRRFQCLIGIDSVMHLFHSLFRRKMFLLHSV